MRVLIVNSEYPPVGGGAGNASAYIAREFVAMGQEVAVVTSRFGNLPIHEENEGIRVYRCLSFRKEVDRSTPLEQLSFMVGSMTDGLRFIRNWKPGVIIAFFGVPSGPAGLLSRQIFRIPYIVSLRGGDVPGFRPYDFRFVHRMMSPLIRTVWNHAEAVVANSEGLKEIANEFSPGMEIDVIPNGVDLDDFQPGDNYDDPPHLLFAGRVVYQKGLDILIEALSNLMDKNWTLSIVGDGPQVATLNEMIRSHGINDRVHFLGWKGQKELHKIFQQANIFVFPSRHEGMPNAVLEAMASGLPVIASRIAGNEELVVHGDTGYLFPLEDRGVFAAYLRMLVDDVSLRSKMGVAARRRAEENYSWQRTAREYLALAKKLTS